MKKSTGLMISILIVLCGMSVPARVALALDAPHNTNDQSWSINCSRCHYSPTSTPTWATLPQTPENTFFNNLCSDCHAPGKLSSTCICTSSPAIGEMCQSRAAACGG